MTIGIINKNKYYLNAREVRVPKKPRRQKHVPLRTCVGCRQVLPKRTLIRIVRSPQGVVIDPTSKMAGRGAYLHDKKACWQQGLKGALANALRTELSAEDKERLIAYMATLPEETSAHETRTVEQV